ncbi:MAG: alginate export family protein [Myxococcota bacterium]
MRRSASAALGQEVADGFHTTPSLFWKSANQRVDVGLVLRTRTEYWDAFSDDSDAFTGTRTRLRAQYSLRETLFVVGELQDVRLNGMASDASGLERVYRSANDADSHANGDDVRQLYAELRPTPTSFVRAGRMDVKLGQEVLYPEPDWRYLKTARLGERLVGTVGWSQSERAYDGASAGWAVAGTQLYGFAARPTTGIFAVDSAYRPLDGISLGGASVTAKRGTLAQHGELSVFGLYYDDDRATEDGGLPNGLDVQTYGASWLSIHPIGPGKLDVLLFGAVQVGDYDDLDQRASAALVELGYQFPDVWGKPWLRIGLNVASGDGDPGDDDHGTFFNILPTNHLYYGFADQLAFQNVEDWFVQLRLAPHPRLGLNLFVHQFRLQNSNDARYSGTGAFNKDAFGYAAQASRGYAHVGTEYDVVATLALHRTVSLELGYAFLDGGALFDPMASQDVHFGYAALELKY